MRKLLTLLVAAVMTMAMVVPAHAGGTCSIFRSWNVGDQLTPSDLTTSYITVGQTNMIPTCMDGTSGNVVAMQSVVDPYPAGTESLPTTLKGEIERLRFTLKQGFGWSQWYAHNGNTLTASGSLYSLTGIWNNVAVTFPGAVKLNITDTNSAAASLLLDLQVGGVSKFRVDKAGNVTATGSISGSAGTGTFASISVTNNANMVNLGTTNIGTFTLAGGALTGARTWTLPDITGIVALTNGGQTFTSAVWNGTAIGSTYGGTGINTSATVTGSLLYTSATGTWSTLSPVATGTVLRSGASSVPRWDHNGPLMSAVFN